MLVLGINRILKWVQITDGGIRHTCPTKESNGELFFHYKNEWHKVSNYVSIYTDELYSEGGRVLSRKVKK